MTFEKSQECILQKNFTQFNNIFNPTVPNTRSGDSTSRSVDSTLEGENSETITMDMLLQLLRNFQGNDSSVSMGNFDSFKENEEDFKLYIQRLENYFSLKAIAEERKGLVFLNSLGSKYYSLLFITPNTKNYNELVKLLSQHLAPEPNEI